MTPVHLYWLVLSLHISRWRSSSVCGTSLKTWGPCPPAPSVTWFRWWPTFYTRPPSHSPSWRYNLMFEDEGFVTTMNLKIFWIFILIHSFILSKLWCGNTKAAPWLTFSRFKHFKCDYYVFQSTLLFLLLLLLTLVIATVVLSLSHL